MSSSVLSGPPYSSEAAALLSIVQGSNETVNTADCGAPEAGDFNWSFFIDLACRNHVALTVYRHRSHRLLHALPADAAGTLRDAYLGMTQHGLRLATIWREVAPALEAEGIRVLAYKGRALAEELYGDASARHTWDVDALVESPECAKRACEVLRLHGYALRLPKTAGTVDDALHHDCELMLDHERGPASLELHWRLLPDAFGAGGSADFMWTGAVRKKVDGVECWVAPPSATLRMLLMHNGIKHDWSELRMVCDVSRWLAKYPGECVMPILESIPRGHLRVKSAAGLVLAARLLGARLEDPDFWSSRILAGATSHAAMAMGRMFGPVERLPVFSGWRANARWLESYPGASRRWVGAYVRTLLTPEFEDVVAAARGPALMRPFAGPLRGLRLAAKSVRRNGDVKTTKNGLNSTQ